jgi:hypothetical protein
MSLQHYFHSIQGQQQPDVHLAALGAIAYDQVARGIPVVALGPTGARSLASGLLSQLPHRARAPRPRKPTVCPLHYLATSFPALIILYKSERERHLGRLHALQRFR